MHKESFNGGRGFLYLFEVTCLLLLIAFHVIVNLLLLFVEDFVLLHVLAAILLLVLQVVVDVLDVSLICLDHSTHISNLFFLLLDLRVVLLDAIHKPLTRFWKWKIHLVCLELKIFLLFCKLELFFTKVLSTLLEGVLF